jgi:very-short-patch-repair endonuclease
MKKSKLEGKVQEILDEIQNKPPVWKEFRFNPERRWRADFAIPDISLLIECEGGTWVKGAHTRGAHFSSDAEKYNWAALNGWIVLRFSSDMIAKGEAKKTIERALEKLWSQK